MSDWDGDGKQTYKDDYVYHEILNGGKGSGSSKHNSNSGAGKAIVIAIIIAVAWELFNAIASAIY